MHVNVVEDWTPLAVATSFQPFNVLLHDCWMDPDHVQNLSISTLRAEA